MQTDKSLAGRLQLIKRGQAGFVVLAQTPRIIEINALELRALFANLKQFVDLLLVFGKGKTHLGVIDGKYALQRGSVLVQRHRNSPKRLRRQHGGVQAWTVGTHHNHVLVAA